VTGNRPYLTDADLDPKGADAAEDAYLNMLLGERPVVTVPAVCGPPPGRLLEPEDLAQTVIDGEGYGWWDEDHDLR